MMHINCKTDLEAYEALYKFRGARIKFYCDHVFYCGIIDEVLPESNHVKIRHTKITDTDTYFGNLCFRFSNIKAFTVIESAKSVNRYPRNDYLLNILRKTKTCSDDSVCKVLYEDRLSEESDDEDSKNQEKEEDFDLNLPSHLERKLPNDSTIIDQLNRDFKLALRHICGQKIIGVSLEGPLISRFGRLTWVCISTRDCVFLFDIDALKQEAFDQGLRCVFEAKSIKKVFHNCRFASDILASLYSTQLTNVFDTQVANLVVDLQRYDDKYEFNNVGSLEWCLRSYLEVPPQFLFKHVELDSVDKYAYFAQRPITHAFRHDLMNKTLYLILLQERLAKELLAPLRQLTGHYLRVLGKASDEEFYTIGKDVSPPDSIPPVVLMQGIQTIKFRKLEERTPVPLSRNLRNHQSEEILEPNRELGSSCAVSKSVVHKNEDCKKKDSQSGHLTSNFSNPNLKISNGVAKTEIQCLSLRPSYKQLDEVYHKLVNKACGDLNPSTVNIKPLDTYISKFSVRKSCSGSSSSGYDSSVETGDHHEHANSCLLKTSDGASCMEQPVPEPTDIWAKIRSESATSDLQCFRKTKVTFLPG